QNDVLQTVAAKEMIHCNASHSAIPVCKRVDEPYLVIDIHGLPEHCQTINEVASIPSGLYLQEPLVQRSHRRGNFLRKPTADDALFDHHFGGPVPSSAQRIVRIEHSMVLADNLFALRLCRTICL